MGAAPPLLAEKSKALPAIGWGGLIAGILDITTAFIRWRPPVRLLQGIASGLLGPRAFQGGLGNCGARLSFALFHRVFSGRRLLRRQPQVGFPAAAGGGLGSFLRHRGVHVHDVGGRSVIGFPKSHAPFSATGLVLSLLTHMFCVGLPIAFAVRRYS